MILSVRFKKTRFPAIRGGLYTMLAWFLLSACTHDKLPTPVIPPVEDRFGNTGKEVYVQINPPLDEAHGYDFNQPEDIYLGADNFLYVADRGNDRIVMMDVGGVIQGVSQYIEHPVAITQNDSLQLLVVNNTNRVFRIDLPAVSHVIDNAPVDTVFVQASEPTRQFTGITVYNNFEYYVTVVDIADSSTNFNEFSFIYDFRSNHTLKGPLPMAVNGTGLFSTILPTSIVSLRERWLDISESGESTRAFYFTHTGRTSLLENNFKVQHITTRLFEGQEVLTPNTGLIGQDIYDTDRFLKVQDIALDRTGFIYVVDAGWPAADPDTLNPPPGFYRFSSNGVLQQSLLGYGSGDKQFKNPGGIAVLPFLENQIVYVVDTGNNRILLFQLSTDN